MINIVKTIILTFLAYNLVACGGGSKTNTDEPIEESTGDGPHLIFSDLVSGPSIGLGDGQGSGVIVTIWGFELGPEQGDSRFEFCDVNNSCNPVAHVYYWKNADGQLPGGPANLYQSHGMQEVSFSIPESPSGTGEVKILTSNGESRLPFTVRDGEIYHVKSTGNDDSGDGSFSNPWLTIEKADKTINSGSTLYVHNVITGDENTTQGIYNNRREAMSSLDAQFGYVAYPNTRPEVIGERGFSVYSGDLELTAGFVLSKFSIFAAEADEDENNQPVNARANVSFGIQGSRDGRAIGNYVTDAHPDDASGACPDAQQAAITAGSLGTDRVSNFKVLGNHIHEYGCDGSSRFQHTTYMTIRSAEDNEQLVAPEMAWNYLQDNKTSGGLHYFDENHTGENCGQFITTMKVHDNVVINQAGPALSVGAKCPVNTKFHFYNNLAINVGLKADFDAVETNGSVNTAVAISVGHEDVTAELTFDNNTFYKWSQDDQDKNLMSCIGLFTSYSNATVNWNSNVCYTGGDFHFIRSNYLGDGMEGKFNGQNNLWFSESPSPINALAPSWDSSPILTDPKLRVDGYRVAVDEGSPLIGQGKVSLLRDVYGRLRATPGTIGAVEYQGE